MIDPSIKAKEHVLYNVKETCAFLGISRSTLYNYENAGIISHLTNENNGRRLYSGRDINTVKLAIR